MSLYVVDTSVVVKIYVPEAHSERSSLFFSDGHELIAPEIMLAEFANVLWKKSTLLGELTEAEATNIVAAAQLLPLGYYFTAGLLPHALRIAMATKRTVYDSLYIALAESEECKFMTDDRKLYQSLQSTSMASYITLIENY